MRTDDSTWQPLPEDKSRPEVSAARAQVVAARLRHERLIAGGQLSSPVIDGTVPNRTLPGYTLVRELHRGGQGVVFLATQESTGRQVAIKFLRGGPRSSSGAGLARFEREVEILSRLKHRNIVTIHDCGRDHQDVYLVMDYVSGCPLDTYVVRDQPPIDETLALFARICDGVNAAHLRGVIHRDLKPGNILIDEHDEPHVLDFGLAKLVGDTEDNSSVPAMTITGQFVGSLPWASPEQAEGRSDQLDIRTDVYSLGVVLYQILTGQFPYPVSGRLNDVVRHIVQTDPIRPSTVQGDIDRELDTILLKCLAKEPERRYQNAGELARDIRRYLAGQAIDAKADSAWYIVRKQLQRHRGVLFAGCAFLALLITSSVIAWSLYAAAVQAKNAEQSRLWESLVAQARAGRSGDRVGHRIDSLSALRRARDIRFDRALRDEAVACLALSDLRCTADVADARFASARGLATIDRFACINASGGIDIRALPHGEVIASFDTGDCRAVSMHFSRDGGFLAARTVRQDQNALWVWETATRKLIRRLDCAPVKFAEFSPDGRRLGMIKPDWHVALLDLAGNDPVEDVARELRVLGLQFDPAGTRLALVATNDSLVAIWDLAESRIVRTLRMPSPPYAAAWSPDGDTLAVGADDHRVYLCNTKGESPPQELRGHRGQVVAIGFDSAGEHLASGGWDRQVRVWNMSRGGAPTATFVGCQLAGLSDRLAVLQNDQLRIWNFVEVTVVRELRAGDNDSARTACFVGSDRLIAASGPGGMHLLDPSHPEASIQLDAHEARRPSASPDGRHVFAVVGNEIVDWTLALDPSGARATSRRVVATVEALSGMALSKDCRSLLVSSGGEIALHDAATGRVLRRAEIGRGAETPALSPDGRHAFVGNWKGSQNAASLIDLETMQVQRRFPGESVAGTFSADGRRLAICTPTRLEVWDVGTQSLRWSMPREPGQELAVRPAFSHDGRLIALSASLYEVHLVDAESGQLILRLPNPELHMIGDLEFSNDGRSMLAATSSSVVHVWDLDALRHELCSLGLDW